MNNKPIKRDENILKLSKEHHFSLLFCWKIKQGLNGEIPTGRIIKYVQYFSTHFLIPHFREEELFLFSALKDEKVDKAIEQHKKINNVIAEVLSDDEVKSKKALQKMAELVDEHVRYEERDLFPHIESKLSSEQLRSIGKKLNEAQPLPLKDEYDDEFWVKK
ncbi:MAG TPA: hemerythrin domain-containing protein [Ginsengibacter sp.]